uniref:Uncharacterized protein n=1 Tax=Rhizophora mucronata TaxID=61149 RepID=A0A2P2LDJ2_RHIMU
METGAQKFQVNASPSLLMHHCLHNRCQVFAGPKGFGSRSPCGARTELSSRRKGKSRE